MPTISPSFREAGAGPSVVCLHANASSSGQWRGLMELLAPSHRVFAADSYGAGKSPAYVDGVIRLGHEVALLEPVFARAGRPFSVIGHSYGAAVALIAAIRQPHKVKALALYEPTLFSLVDEKSPAPNEADGIRNAVAQSAAALKADIGYHVARIGNEHQNQYSVFIHQTPKASQADVLVKSTLGFISLQASGSVALAAISIAFALAIPPTVGSPPEHDKAQQQQER